MSGDVGRRKSHFFRWKRKAGVEGKERGHEAALKGDFGEKTATEEKG